MKKILFIVLALLALVGCEAPNMPVRDAGMSYEYRCESFGWALFNGSCIGNYAVEGEFEVVVWDCGGDYFTFFSSNPRDIQELDEDVMRYLRGNCVHVRGYK